ncbi:MAG: dihydroneopterin aldolase [Parafilimonas sp.]|nr:dihydroneopterin aldolase [Parafilimonas sp.]
MLKIELSKLQFHGFHGVHEEETKAGGNFEVNMTVYFNPENIPVKHLHETIDYTQLYEVIKQRMQKPTKLLETLATEIARQVLDRFSRIEEVSIAIKKLNPPIAFFNGTVAAEYTLKRN